MRFVGSSTAGTLCSSQLPPDNEFETDTVTVSSTVPTFKSAFTVAVNDPVSSIPSRLKPLKPVSVESHRIRAGPQINDSILAGPVGDGRSQPLDQGVTRRFDRDAWQHRPRGVLYHIGSKPGRMRMWEETPRIRAT